MPSGTSAVLPRHRHETTGQPAQRRQGSSGASGSERLGLGQRPHDSRRGRLAHYAAPGLHLRLQWQCNKGRVRSFRSYVIVDSVHCCAIQSSDCSHVVCLSDGGGMGLALIVACMCRADTGKPAAAGLALLLQGGRCAQCGSRASAFHGQRRSGQQCGGAARRAAARKYCSSRPRGCTCSTGGGAARAACHLVVLTA